MAREAQLVGAPELPAIEAEVEARRRAAGPSSARTADRCSITTFTVILLALFLSPLLRTLSLSLKSADQITTIGAPIWPADPGTFEYEGETLDVYLVPLPDGTTQGARPSSIPGGRRAASSIRPTRMPVSSPGRARGAPSSSRGSSRRSGATSRRSGPASTSRA